MPHIPTTPVSLAEEILHLAKSAFFELSSVDALSTSSDTSDPLVVHTAKIQMQDLCNKLLQSVFGRQEYTILLAGGCCFVQCSDKF
jgi:hypothetical protein